MSFLSMNGVNAQRSGGLAGTRRGPVAQAPLQQPVQFGQFTQPVQAARPQQAMMPAAPPQPQPLGLAGTAMRPRPGMHKSAVSMLNSGVNGVGVVPGQAGPALPPPPPVQKFDPNDPANAALAGYMHGA